jgi:hypothetical protein
MRVRLGVLCLIMPLPQMYAYLEWPCECRGTVWVRVGPEATHYPRPYIAAVACKIEGKRAVGGCFNRPAEGVLPEYVTAAKEALAAAGYRLVWRRMFHGKDREIVTN